MNEIKGIKVARGRAIPNGTQVRLVHDGVEGALHVYLRVPWQNVWADFGLRPILDREITLPLVLAFLCHAKGDQKFGEDVGRRLLRNGVLTLCDGRDLLPGDQWERKIEAAIERSDFVPVFLAPRSLSKTGYVQREFRLALQQQERRPFGERYIIPIIVEPCEPSREFGGIHFLKLWEDGAFEKLKRRWVLRFTSRRCA